MIYSRDGMNRHFTQHNPLTGNLSPYTNEMLSNNQAAGISNIPPAVKLNYDDYLGINLNNTLYNSTNESPRKTHLPQPQVSSNITSRGENYYKKIENYVPRSLNYNIPREIQVTNELKVSGTSGDAYFNRSIDSRNNSSRHSSRASDMNFSKNLQEGVKNNGNKEIKRNMMNVIDSSVKKLEKTHINTPNDFVELKETNKVTDGNIKNNRTTREYPFKSEPLKNTLPWQNSQLLKSLTNKSIGGIKNGITRDETTIVHGNGSHPNKTNNNSAVNQNNSQLAHGGSIAKTDGTNTSCHRVVIKLDNNLENEIGKFSENGNNNERRHIRIYEENNVVEINKERGKETIGLKREEVEKKHNTNDIKKENSINEKDSYTESGSLSDKTGKSNTSIVSAFKENSKRKSSFLQERKRKNNKMSVHANIKGTLPHVVPLNINDDHINNEGALEIFKNIVIIDKYNGLKEWNGYEWRNIKSTYTFFNKARYDNKGNLWCINDLCELFKLSNSKFQPLGFLGNEEIIDIGFDKRNNLWCVNRKGDLLKWFKTEWKKISYSGFHKLSSIAFDKEGRLWGINSKRALAVWNSKDKRWEEKIIKNNMKILCMDFDENGMFWIVTTTGVLLSYCSGNWMNYGFICRNKLISISFKKN